MSTFEITECLTQPFIVAFDRFPDLNELNLVDPLDFFNPAQRTSARRYRPLRESYRIKFIIPSNVSDKMTEFPVQIPLPILFGELEIGKICILENAGSLAFVLLELRLYRLIFGVHALRFC